MKKYYQLSYILASIYLLTATVILFSWAAGLSPVGPTFFSRHSLLEILILSLPIIPAIIMDNLLSLFHQGLAENLVFVEFVPTVYYLLLVVINTISWFFMGKFLQFAFSKLFPHPSRKLTEKSPI